MADVHVKKRVSTQAYGKLCAKILENSGASYFSIDYVAQEVFYSGIDKNGARRNNYYSFAQAQEKIQSVLQNDSGLSIPFLRALCDEKVKAELRFAADMDGNGFRWYKMQFARVRGEANAITEITGIITDIDRLERKIKRLEKRADSDPMTGLYNRLATETLINNALIEAGGEGAIFMIDIDDFKKVNDTMGHHAGDLLIRAASACIASIFREADVVGRVGGDEFVAFAPHLLRREHVENKAREIVEEMRAADISGAQAKTCSVGAVILKGGMHTFEEGFQLADKALYKAKSLGKNGYYLLDEH